MMAEERKLEAKYYKPTPRWALGKGGIAYFS
jgi:hypothetical protein